MALAQVSQIQSKKKVPTQQKTAAKSARSQHPVNTGSDLGWMSLPSLVTPTIQPKLKIGEPNDQYEQEADRVAEQVMRMPDTVLSSASNGPDETYQQHDRASSPLIIQRLCTQCATDKEETLQRKPSSNKPFVSALNSPLKAQFEFPHQFPSIQRQEMEEEEENIRTKPLESTITTGESNKNTINRKQEHEAYLPLNSRLSGLNTGGSPLPQPLRTFYEHRFGYDFGQVRIHQGSEAEHLSELLHAYAFTYGNHVWLGANETLKPSLCLTHEFVHIVQQTKPPRIERPSSQQSQPVRTSTIATPAHLVQRDTDAAYFWIPKKFSTGKATGKEIQDHLFADAKRSPDMKQEVGIPNAARKINATGSEYNLDIKKGGQADLYLAEGGKPVGVRFNQDGSPGGLNIKYHTRRPLVKKGEIKKIDESPKWIRIGEIKPASKDQIVLGKEQVQNYLKGINLAVIGTNAWASKEGKNERWELPEQAMQPMESGDFKLHPKYTFNRHSPLNDLDLILGSFSRSEKFRVEINPQKDLGQAVKGGLYANYHDGGVWAYFARPANPDAIFKLPKLTKELKAPVKMAKKLENEVVHKITGTPLEVIQTYRKPEFKHTAAMPSSNPSLQIQRKIKEPRRIRDDKFDPVPVKKARAESYRTLKAQEKTKPFKQLRLIELAYKAEEGLPPKVRNSQWLPDKNELAVTLDTEQNLGSREKGKGLTQKPIKRPLPTLYSWLKLWTNPAIDILADFRKRFGTTFVTIYRKIVSIKTNISNKIKEKFEQAGGNAKGTSYGAIAIRAIGRGLKAIGQILIPQTLRLVVDSLIEGIKERLLKVLPLDIESLERAVANQFSEITSVGEKLKSFYETIQARIDTIINDFGKQLAGIVKVISLAKDISRIVKWTVRAIQCGTPPGWGCAKLVFSSLTAWVAEQVLNDCSLQKEIACSLADLDFIQELPKFIAGSITSELNTALGGIDPRLSPLFAKIEPFSPIDCRDIGCEGEPSELHKAYVRLEDSLKEKWGSFGAASIMNSLLEVSRKSGLEESDILTPDEVDQLNKLLLETNISPIEFEILAQDLTQSEVKPATVQEFIDSIKQRQQQMFSPIVEEEATGGTKEGKEGKTGGKYATGDETVDSGESEGIPTVEASNAKFEGNLTNSLSRTRIIVENPSIKKHTAKSTYKVDLMGLIDGQPKSRITNVSAYVPKRIWRPDTKKMEIRYQLREGVCFPHQVPDVPEFCVEKGTVIPMFVKRSSPKKQQNEPED